MIVSLAVVTIAPMHEPDLDAVLAIERASFPNPWTAQQFRDELANARARCLVARCDGAVAAHLIFWELPGELEIMNLACHPFYRRRAVASALMSHLVAFARARDAERIHLEVRRSNAGAIALYRDRFGFVEVGVRPRYYADNREDALLLQRDLRTEAT